MPGSKQISLNCKIVIRVVSQFCTKNVKALSLQALKKKMDFNTPNDYFEIDESCFESFPCDHRVTFKNTGNNCLLSGINIVELCLQYNVPIPSHFQEYYDPRTQQAYNPVNY